MLSFMMFIQKCKQFSIIFGGVSGENWLMNLFYDGQVDNEKGDHKTDLTIAVQKERSAPYLHRKFELCLLQQDDDQKCNASVELKYLDYGSNDNDGRYESKVKAQLTHLHPNTESITLDCQSEVAEYLDLVLNTPSAHLEKICVRSGKLVGHIKAEDLPPRAPHIKRLAFDYTQIDQAVLPLLSLDFPVLDHLTFGACRFYEFGDLDHETVASNISMPNTVISTLKIDVLNITAPREATVWLSLCSSDEGTTNYYIIVFCKESDPTLQITTKDRFDQMQIDSDPQEDRSNIYIITTKTIKQVIVSACRFWKGDQFISIPLSQPSAHQ